MRDKPREARIQIAFAGAILTTIFVALAWILSLPAQLGSLGGEDLETAPTEEGRPIDELLDFTRGRQQSGASEGADEEAAEPQETASREVLIGTSTRNQ